MTEVLLVDVAIEPSAPGEVTVVGRRPLLSAGDDALLDLRVRYEDFPGRGPVSYGRTLSRAVPFGDDGVARRGDPLRRRYELRLPEAADALMRRVRVTGQLWPVDVVGPAGRRGGRVLPLRGAVLESLGPGGGVPLRALLAAPAPAASDVFLAAVREAREERTRVLGDLVGALAGRGGEAREGALAALFALTGLPHGRATYRWSAWWRAVQRGQVDDVGPPR